MMTGNSDSSYVKKVTENNKSVVGNHEDMRCFQGAWIRVVNGFNSVNIKSRVFKPLLYILSLLMMMSCENDIEKVNLITGKNNAPVESAEGLEILYSDSGIVKVKVKTPELNRFMQPKPVTELPKGVFVEFFNDQQQVTSTLTSKYALRDDADKTMEAKKDVVVVNVKGDKLETEYLKWDEKSGMISSPDFVKITTADEIIYGNGFESNQDFSRYRIFDIKGIINLKKDENTKDS
ncbi:MAG: LPS export ABC transporter periplasmic protein LptC [Bacteroidetes bacterium]|jgi:LPS export ABC transporter protein LptC|nr:LPS export ABC transporter periplasmic protein LptC [Bacteroidota bacterium]